jgi:hypothetical protein
MSEWGLTSGGSGTANSDYNYYQGGISPNVDDLQLDSFDLRINSAATDYRAAVYVGGLTSDMSGAVLLEDLGVQTSVNAGDVLNFPSATNPAIPKNTLIWLAFKADFTGLWRIGSGAPQDDITVVRRYFNTGDRVPSVAFETNPPAAGDAYTASVWDTVINYSVSVSGPTLTGPDTTTVGDEREAAGTNLDTVTTAGLKVESSYSLSLTIDAQTATTLTQTDDIGTPTLGSPVDSLPVTADTLAAGTTVWQIQQWVDDGTNPEVQRNITLAGVAGTKTVQFLTTGDDAANTTIGESFVGTDIIAVEDDMTMTYQEVTDTVTLTVNADGTFTTDKDQTIALDLTFWSPSTGEASLARVTILGSAILGTSGLTRALTRNLTRSLTRSLTRQV